MRDILLFEADFNLKKLYFGSILMKTLDNSVVFYQEQNVVSVGHTHQLR